MAQLILGVAGAVVGTYIGVGPGVGWAIGSAIGGAIAGPTKVEGSHQDLMDLRVTGTEYGQAIPYVRGAASIAGQVWWNTDRRPTTISTTTSSGGKGGGGQESTSTTITYDMDMLIGLTDNPIVGVARIWANGDLIYTASASASDASLAASIATDKWTRLTVYNGASNQLPDPTYEAAVGLGKAPAYRGRGMVFIEGLKLGQSGQIPNLTFEVVADGTVNTTLPGFATAWTDEGNGEVVFTNNRFTITKTYLGSSTWFAAWLRNPTGLGGVTINTNIPWTAKRFMEFVPKGTSLGQGPVFGLVGKSTWMAAPPAPYGEYAINPFDPAIYGLIRNISGIGSGYIVNGNYGGNTPPVVFGLNDVIGMAVDFDNRRIWWSINGVWLTGDPATDTGPMFTLPNDPNGYDPYLSVYQNTAGTSSIETHVLAADFVHAPPTGFLPYLIPTGLVGLMPPTVQSVVSDLCLRAGLASSQFDVSALASITRPVKCMPVSQISATRSTLELLMTAFFFDMVVSDKIYFKPRGGAPVASIPYLDLGASKGGSAEEPLPLLQMNELEVPAQIVLSYINVGDDYQPDTQYSDRLISASAQTVSPLQIALGMTPAEAKGVVDTMLQDQAASVVSTTIKLLGDYCALEPTDVVTVTGFDGSAFRVRLVKKTDSYPVLEFQAVIDNVSVLVSPGITSMDYTSSTEVAVVPDALMEMMDIPILRDADNDAGFYITVKGATSAKYPGAAVYSSVDDVTYAARVSVAGMGAFGLCSTTLGDWTGPRVFDEKNSVTVNIGEAVLGSTTRDAVLHDLAANAMLVGAEIIQFRTATLLSPGVYKLTGLLRGGRGTEWAMTGHVPGERCVVLQTAGFSRLAVLSAEIGLSRFYKAVTLGRAPSTAAGVPFVDGAVGLKPFSPVDLRVVRTSDPLSFVWSAYQILPTIKSWWDIAWNGSVYCAVAFGGPAATSPDGINWTEQAIAAGAWIRIIWTGTKFVALSASSVTTSADGVTWTAPVTLPASTGQYTNIAWNGSVLCAITGGNDSDAGSADAATSTDGGATWTTRTLPAVGHWHGMDTDGTKFCITDGGTSPYGFGMTRFGANAVATSADGITWILGALPVVAHWGSLCWGGSQYLLTQFNSPTGQNATSPDGVTWTLHSMSPGYWVGSAWNGSKFGVAGLRPVTVGGSTSMKSALMTTADAVTWDTPQDLPLQGDWRAAAPAGAQFVVLAGSTVDTPGSPPASGHKHTAKSGPKLNEATLTWHRRSRLAVRMIGSIGISVPLGETVESYEVDILNATDDALIETIATSTPSAAISSSLTTPATDLVASVTPASLSIQSYPLAVNFIKSDAVWAGFGLTISTSGQVASLVAADGTITEKQWSFAEKVALSTIADAFSLKSVPTSGWSVLRDGSTITTADSDTDSYYSMIRDHRAAPTDVIVTSGRSANLCWCAPGGAWRSIYRWMPSFTVFDKFTIPGAGALGAARYPVVDFYSGASSQFDDPSVFVTTAADGVTSPEMVVDCVAFGGIIYTVAIAPLTTYSSAGKTVDITNLLNSHLTLTANAGLRTYRHTISAGVIAALDGRDGVFRADRINATQAVEWGGGVLSVINMATGAVVGTPASMGYDVVALAGDWTAPDLFYSVTAAGLMRKHAPNGTVIASLATGVSASDGRLLVSSEYVYLNVGVGVGPSGAHSYQIAKDLSGMSAVSTVIPNAATPDSNEVLAFSAGRTSLSKSAAVAAPVPLKVRVYQMSDVVGRGYPLEQVL